MIEKRGLKSNKTLEELENLCEELEQRVQKTKDILKSIVIIINDERKTSDRNLMLLTKKLNEEIKKI